MEEEHELYVAVKPYNVFVTKDPDRTTLVNFLEAILPKKQEGWLTLGYIPDIKLAPKDYRQTFVQWAPYYTYLDKFENVFDFVDEHKQQDCYFSPLLFSEKKRTKEYALPGSVLWADLDECKPEWLGKYGDPLPNILVRSSAEHWQAYWLLYEVISAEEIERINKRIVYAYRREGLEIDYGWTRTKILRLPTAHNNKRDVPFKVEAYITKAERCKAGDFDVLPKAKTTGDMAKRLVFGKTAVTPDMIDKLPIPNDIKELIHNPPQKGGRSEACFRVIAELHRAGLTPGEIKAIIKDNPIGERYYE